MKPIKHPADKHTGNSNAGRFTAGSRGEPVDLNSQVAKHVAAAGKSMPIAEKRKRESPGAKSRNT